MVADVKPPIAVTHQRCSPPPHSRGCPADRREPSSNCPRRCSLQHTWRI
jgi:hypothetical protein